MSQADSARFEAIDALVKELHERVSELEKQVGSLQEQIESKDMMAEMYPATTGPKPGRRSG